VLRPSASSADDLLQQGGLSDQWRRKSEENSSICCDCKFDRMISASATILLHLPKLHEIKPDQGNALGLINLRVLLRRLVGLIVPLEMTKYQSHNKQGLAVV